jgi:hypothetical protein
MHMQGWCGCEYYQFQYCMPLPCYQQLQEREWHAEADADAERSLSLSPSLPASLSLSLHKESLSSPACGCLRPREAPAGFISRIPRSRPAAAGCCYITCILSLLFSGSFHSFISLPRSQLAHAWYGTYRVAVLVVDLSYWIYDAAPRRWEFCRQPAPCMASYYQCNANYRPRPTLSIYIWRQRLIRLFTPGCTLLIASARHQLCPSIKSVVSCHIYSLYVLEYW